MIDSSVDPQCRETLAERIARQAALRPEQKARQAYGSSTIKRTLDLALSITALLFFAPLMIVIAIAVGMTGPILFSQDRIGRNGQLFRCHKFRTMAIDAEQRLADLLANDPEARREWDTMRKLTRDPRITPLGRFLRLSSLDELPQLINVLLGDMSAVGPRPIVPSEAIMYNHYIRDYCRVRPGLTGLWQVSGRNGTTYRRRVALDVYYSRNAKLAMDFKIIFKTIPAVLRSDGVY